MSNIIKSSYAFVNGEEKKVIDSNERSEEFRLINFASRKRNSLNLNESEFPESVKGGFTEGLQVTVIDSAITQEEEPIELTYEQMLEEAKEKADHLQKDALAQAKIVSQKLYEEAQTKGYEEGLNRGMVKAKELEDELNELIQTHNQEYSQQIKQLEPQFADIVASLVEKLTGIVIEDKKEVLSYLIHNAIVDADTSKSFVIRVSKEDYGFVFSKWEEIKKLVNEQTVIDIVMDKDFSKNQCMIEVDSGVIDCGLDAQLSNLIQDIKLLSTQKE